MDISFFMNAKLVLILIGFGVGIPIFVEGPLPWWWFVLLGDDLCYFVAIVKCGVDYKQLNVEIAQARIPNWMSALIH